MACASLKIAAALSKSQQFSSRHLAENWGFIPDFSLNARAKVCLADWSRSGAGGGAAEVLGGGLMKAFLVDRSVAAEMKRVSLIIQKPAFCGTTRKHLKRG